MGKILDIFKKDGCVTVEDSLRMKIALLQHSNAVQADLLLSSYNEEKNKRYQAEDKIKKLYDLIDSENDINILRERAREEI